MSCPHGRNIWSNKRHQWSHTGHQENHSLGSHMALLIGHQKMWYHLCNRSKNMYFLTFILHLTVSNIIL